MKRNAYDVPLLAHSITGYLEQISRSVQSLCELANEKNDLQDLCVRLLNNYKILAEVFLDIVLRETLSIPRDTLPLDETLSPALHEGIVNDNNHILSQEEILALLNPDNN